MNNDLIDRIALLKSFDENCAGECAVCLYHGKCKDNIYCELVANAPTVPLPDFKDGYKQAIIDGKTNFSRPQGEWKYDGFCVTTSQYKCSVCGMPSLDRSKYCPNCGAKMKGGEGE